MCEYTYNYTTYLSIQDPTWINKYHYIIGISENSGQGRVSSL